MIIVRSLVDLAHALDLKVVAEYVEDEATAEALKSMGVEFPQGYALGRPVDILSFTDHAYLLTKVLSALFQHPGTLRLQE